MERVCIVADFDGTLVLRDCPLETDVARLIVGVLRRGWSFALLTGRNATNVQQRFLEPLLALPAIDVGLVSQGLRVFTCEGATAWRLAPSGAMQRDLSYSPHSHFSPSERRQLEHGLSQHLQPTLDQAGLSLAAGPEWWESALLVFKVAGDLSARGAVAGRLEMLLGADLRIRVGVAGSTTIVIAPREVGKRRALAEIAATLASPAYCVYLADEFVPPGNDADTADLAGVVKISVDRDQTLLPPTVLSAGGSGPAAVKRWLSSLLAADDSRFVLAKDLIHSITAELNRTPM